MEVYIPYEQKYIDKLTEIVEENFQNSNFGVAELAKEMGMSHSTLHRRLKTIARQSVSQFIRETRLKRAMELLQLQKGTVAEIAYDVGFGSTAYFSKCFHDYYGVTPRVVKKQVISRQEIGPRPVGIQGSISEEQSIAILPFDNYTGNNNLDYLVHGIHDALIGELGRLRSIRIVSKTSVYAFNETDKSLQDIAGDLNVDSVLEGSVLFVDESIKLQLRLMEVLPEEKVLWSQTFNVEISDVLKLYSQVLKKIASEIRFKLSPIGKAKITERRDVNPDSYKAYLRGKYFLYQLTEEGMKKGLECLHEAVMIDPAEALAHAGLALGYLEIAHGPLNPGDAYIRAESAALQALKLDPDLAEAQLALAELGMYSTWQYDESEYYFKRAIELNPYLSIAHYHYAWLLFLLGRKDEAVVEHELAQRHDPFNPMLVGHFGILYAYLHRYEEAIRQVNKSFELQRACPDGYFALVETSLARGQVDKAISESKDFAKADPTWKWVQGYTYASTGYRKEAEKVLEELLAEEPNSWNALGICGIYGNLGKMDEAYHWMSYEPHHAWVPWLTVMPMGKPFWKDSRFTEFKRKWNLTNI